MKTLLIYIILSIYSLAGLAQKYPDSLIWAKEVTKVKFEKGKVIPVDAAFLISCGGTLGYIPTCRFVFDKKSNSWTRYTWDQTAATLKSK